MRELDMRSSGVTLKSENSKCTDPDASACSARARNSIVALVAKKE